MADEIEERESAGAGRWKGHRSAIPAFRGCDYIVKPYRLKFKETMDGHVSSGNKKEYLKDIEKNNKWPPKAHGEEDGLQPAVGYAKEAEHTINMFEYHPVWKIMPKDGGSVDVSSTFLTMPKLNQITSRREKRREQHGQNRGRTPRRPS